MASDKKLDFIPHLLRGNNALRNKQYDEAIQAYKEALRINENFSLIYAMMGKTYSRKGDLDRAIEHYKRSLELKPEQADILLRLGKAYEEKKMPIQAAAAYDLASETDRMGSYEEQIDTSLEKVRRKVARKKRGPLGKAWKQVKTLFTPKHHRITKMPPEEETE